MARRGRGEKLVTPATPPGASADLARMGACAEAPVWHTRGTQPENGYIKLCLVCSCKYGDAVFSGFDSRRLH